MSATARRTNGKDKGKHKTMLRPHACQREIQTPPRALEDVYTLEDEVRIAGGAASRGDVENRLRNFELRDVIMSATTSSTRATRTSFVTTCATRRRKIKSMVSMCLEVQTK